LLCIPVVGQTADDIIATYQAALANDPRFQSARYKYEGALEKIPQARALLLPSLGFDAHAGNTDQDVLAREQINFLDPNNGLGRSSFSTSSFSFSATQPIFRYASWVGLAQAKAVVRQAYAEYVASEQDLMLRSAEAYLNILAANDELQLAQAEQSSAEQQAEIVQAKRSGGLATVTDEYEADARISLVEADVALALDMLDDANEAMREIAGDAIGEIRPLREAFPMARPEPEMAAEWVATALSSNLALIAVNEGVEIANQEVRRRRAERYPTLDLVASQGNSDTADQVAGADVNSAVVALQVSVPLFTGGGARSKSREASMMYRQALAQRTAQHRFVMRETRAAFRGALSAITRVEALQRSVKSQESALDGKTKGYRSGANKLVEVLDAERDLFATKRDYAQARYEYLLNMLRLKQQAGSLSISDLEYVNSFLVAR
jgi:outer membrane protein